MRAFRSFFAIGVLLAAAVSAAPVAAQDYTMQPESKVWVDGTSNKSDWTVHATEMDGSLSMNGGPTSLQLTIASSKIESKKSTIMDRLMHQALQVEAHPTITYSLNDATPTDGELQTTGQLTIAGVTRDVEMTVTREELDNGAIRFTGTTPLKMTDFELKPPTAMFGALRTGDDVTVGFDVVFAPK